MVPDSRPMSYSTGLITTFVMPHMQNVRGDLFGGELMALVDQAAAVAAIRHAGGPAGTPGNGRGGFFGRETGGAPVTPQATRGLFGHPSLGITPRGEPPRGNTRGGPPTP